MQSWKECAESSERHVHTGTAGSRDHRATVSQLEPRFDPSLKNRTRRSAEVAVGRQEAALSLSLKLPLSFQGLDVAPSSQADHRAGADTEPGFTHAPAGC